MGFLSKLLILLLKVTKVTTGHQKLPKIGQNSIITLFLPEGPKKASAEGRSPPQELEEGQRSGPYLLVADKRGRGIEKCWQLLTKGGRGSGRQCNFKIYKCCHGYIGPIWRTCYTSFYHIGSYLTILNNWKGVKTVFKKTFKWLKTGEKFESIL